MVSASAKTGCAAPTLARSRTMRISSARVAGAGSNTVLKRRRSAVESSLTPRSRSLAVAMTLKPATACTSVLNSGTAGSFR